MSLVYGFYYHSLITHLIENDEFDLLRLMTDWCQYNNPRLHDAVELILENIDELSDDFFDRFIELLDKYEKTEDALLCVRKLIEREKKERFVL